MKLKILRDCFLFSFLIILNSCAIQVGPQGGPKDITPPKILSEEPINNTVNFNKDRIVLTCNEYIKLDNPNQEIIISPLIAQQPKISVKKKSVIVKFNQKLKENTTYTIQFGKSISDITENNILPDYSYLFSTGPKLDSLEIKGKVKDLLNNNFKENIKLMLYRTGNDSSVYKVKPEYYTKTDKKGEFVFKHLHANNYMIYALDDENSNYLFDKGEKIAFLNDSIILRKNIELPDLNLFKEKETKINVTDNGIKEFNKYYIALNSSIDSLNLTQLIQNKRRRFANNVKIISTRDSVFFWLNPKPDSIKVIVDLIGENLTSDTLLFTTISLQEKKNKIPTKLTLKPTINPYTTGKILIEFNEPVSQINFTKIDLFSDSNQLLKLPELVFTDSSHTILQIKLNYESGKNYKITFNKGSFMSINKLVNDSVSIPIVFLKETELGSISTSIEVNENGIPLLVQLLDDKNNIIREDIINKSSKIIYNNLQPGKYLIRCIIDNNRNSRWDTGNLLKRRQPEEVIYYKEEINLKANWELNDLIIKIQ
jgi:hypothetical protein